MRFSSLTLVIMLFFPLVGYAGEKGPLPIPRFVSIKSSEANARIGPNVRYPIQWVFVKKGEPVEVVAEFEQWRKVRDKQGDTGWIHESMISGRRHIVVVGDTPAVLRKEPDNAAAPLLRAEPEVRGELISSTKEWCHVIIGGTKGWMEKKNIWGIYQNEVDK